MSSHTSVSLVPGVSVPDLGAGPSVPLTDTDIAPGFPFLDYYKRLYVVTNGGTPYTAKITLDRTDNLIVNGAVIHLRLDFDNSDDPTVEVYDDTTGGTLLATAQGQADAATSLILDFLFNGTSWEKWNGRYDT